MKKIIVTISIAIFFTNACKESPKEKKPVKEQAQTQKKSINAAFSIEILEKEGLDVIDPNAKIKVLASG